VIYHLTEENRRPQKVGTRRPGGRRRPVRRRTVGFAVFGRFPGRLSRTGSSDWAPPVVRRIYKMKYNWYSHIACVGGTPERVTREPGRFSRRRVLAGGGRWRRRRPRGCQDRLDGAGDVASRSVVTTTGAVGRPASRRSAVRETVEPAAGPCVEAGGVCRHPAPDAGREAARSRTAVPVTTELLRRRLTRTL
jgi:hypothetical protein